METQTGIPTSPILVTGGTGTLGRLVAPRLRASGARVRVLARGRHESEGIEFVMGDLATGEGVDAAVAGVETVVHLAGSARGDGAKARTLVRAATRAGVRHLIYISVVGADRIPMAGRIDRALFGYFGAKFEAEQVLSQSGIPWTTAAVWVDPARSATEITGSIVDAERRVKGATAFRTISVIEPRLRKAPRRLSAERRRVPATLGVVSTESPITSHRSSSPDRADFIREIVAVDVRAGRYTTIVTRFPPEPNGHLHIGHAKSICLNFGVARDFGGYCNLRFDDTNPVKEEQEYIDAIEHDIRWLGFDWGERVHHASDYFEQLYEWANHLIRNADAYVDDLSADEIREHRGTLTEPGRNSPFRERSVEENLDLFARMRAGEFPNGARVLRAKIDMASPNINLRDPILYRIVHAAHPRTGDAWSIYPTYDFAHGQSDAIEGVTHSICTLEFEAHRPLYDWLIEHLPVPSRPRQYEFARLNLTSTVLSKRFLLRLVEEGRVRGWDDPRMPTISGLRRRGFPAEGIRDFAEMVGVTKTDSVIEYGQLEYAVRAVLNRTAPRRFGVLDPLKVVIENYPEGQVEDVEVPNNPEDPAAGPRPVPFSRELWIERHDFQEDPAPKFFRLAPGREVRLRAAYFITCQEVVKDAAGRVVELRCTYDPATRGGDAPDGRRPKATLHWVSTAHAVPAEVRLYDHLYTRPDPGASGDLLADLNPNSETVVRGAFVEPSLADAQPGETVQFERLGYFAADSDSRPGQLVFNRTLTLKDTWAKVQARG